MPQPNSILCHIIAGLALGVCASLPAGGSSAPASAERPTPADWEQWQPQTDTADGRLNDARVSAWESEIRLADFLVLLSDETSVQLAATDDLCPVTLSVFSEGRTLLGVMASLARLVDGYWVFPRGASPESPSYVLLQHGEPTADFDEWDARHVRNLKLARASLHRAEREARLAKCIGALSLSQQELLDRYGATDPWLCGSLLHPVERPILEQIAALAEAEREELLAAGEIRLPLREFTAQFGQHLADYSRGRWGRPATLQIHPDPDRLARFATPEDRWAHSTVHLWWSKSGLQCLLDVPDVARFDAYAVRMPQGSPEAARHKLASLGYDTRDADASALPEAGGAHSRHRDHRDLPYEPLARLSDEADPRLALEFELTSPTGGPIPVSSVLQQVARACEVAVIAHYLPPEMIHLRPPEPADASRTVGSVLNEIRRRRGGAFWWDFRGRYLVAGDVNSPYIAASAIPQDVLDTWRKKLSPGGSFRLDEVADLMASLNVAQAAALIDEFEAFQELPIYTLALYGELSETQRRLICEQQQLSFAGMSEKQKAEMVRFAQVTRPWTDPSDYQGAVLRVVPRQLSSGKPGISLIIDYGFAEAPGDRDVLFTCPLQYNVGQDGFID